jgi:hypothetical protein
MIVTKAQQVEAKKQTCIVCSREENLGIHIWDQFICQHCEGEMVGTEVTDEKYPFFVKQMRKIWLQKNA